MDISFTKAHGTGNDFIIIYADDIPNIQLNENLIQQLCHRRKGVGSDGLLFISHEQTLDFKLDYYNSNGTWETFCANGSRCAVIYMHQRGLIKEDCDFHAGDGPHSAKIIDKNHVSLKMKPPQYKSEKILTHGFFGFHIDSGAQHFVVNTNNLASINVEKDGRNIRNDKYFAPDGINVNFMENISHSKLKVCTYEKGIERAMLSCGSGSVAAAYHAFQSGQISSPVKVVVPGGNLNIQFDSLWKNVWLSGEAILLFNSTIQLDNL